MLKRGKGKGCSSITNNRPGMDESDMASDSLLRYVPRQKRIMDWTT